MRFFQPQVPWVPCALSLGPWAPGDPPPSDTQAAPGLWTRHPPPQRHRPSQGARSDFFKKTISPLSSRDVSKYFQSRT